MNVCMNSIFWGVFCGCGCVFGLGPTVLEVFNTLLRHLKLSVDYELTGSYDCTSSGTKTIKQHEERQLQDAVIKTIGEWVTVRLSMCVLWLMMLVFQQMHTLEYPFLECLIERTLNSDCAFSRTVCGFRFLCQHSAHIPALWGDAFHHGEDSNSRHAPNTATCSLWVGTAASWVSKKNYSGDIDFLSWRTKVRHSLVISLLPHLQMSKQVCTEILSNHVRHWPSETKPDQNCCLTKLDASAWLYINANTTG